jgi:hypothetical protein
MLAGRGLDQRVGLFGPAGGGVKAPLQIARGLRPVERRQFHAPVFGKHQKIGPRLRCPVHPCAGLFLVGVPIGQEIERIGGGSDLHVRLLIQNCSGFLVFSASPMSRQPKWATTPSSGAYPRARQNPSSGRYRAGRAG